MDFNGIPLHPLIVHAVVVLTPLAGLSAILYAVVPRWRWAVRWPFVALAVIGAGTTYVGSISGHDLRDQLHLHGALMETHETWAGRLELGMWVLAAAALVAAFVLPFGRPSGPDRAARGGVLAVPVVVVLVLVGLAVLLFVYQTGDAGAHLVWDGTPK